MDTLKKIAKSIWESRKIIDFGGSPSWDEDSFLKKWINSKESNLWNNKAGWYWFEADISIDEFIGMALPLRLPPKATRFSEVASFNSGRLHIEDIHTGKDFNVVYSGQENRVFSRLRTHFSLTDENTGTGALGISSYPLNKRKWRVGVFHDDMIDKMQGLDLIEKTILNQLISEQHSRELVEACWRIDYGWPILCIK